MTQHWLRDSNPAFFNIYQRPWEEAAGPPLVRGLEQRLISEDPATSASTSMVRLPAGWEAGAAGDATVEFFVLEGSVEVGSDSLGVGGYAFFPRGNRTADLSSLNGAHVYLFWTPEMDVGTATDVRLTSFWAEPWQEGLLDKKLPQRWKSLRLPDASDGVHGGPAGLLLVMQWLPGFVAPMEHLHSTWEELIFFAGDWLTERGIVVPGTYLGNPAQWWHAPVTTRDGAVAIVHANRPLDLLQRPCEGGEEFCRAYLERGSWLELPEHGGAEGHARYGLTAPGGVAVPS